MAQVHGQAQALSDIPLERIDAIVRDFQIPRLGATMLGANDLRSGPYMLLDGNHRAVALERLAGSG
jgi:hypothetical protein